MNKASCALSVLGAVFCAMTCNAAETETVAVIGTGDLGDSLGPRFASLGYTVIYGSRDPESRAPRHSSRKTVPLPAPHRRPTTRPQADIVVLAIPWPAMETVARSLGDLDGKIVIDPSMPFKQGADGYPERLFATSSAEMIQDWNPGARVVKTLGTMGSHIIDDPNEAGGVVSMPVASDDKDARETVARILAAMQFDPVDFGPLRMARDIEILQMIYMIPLVQNRPEGWEFHFRSTHPTAAIYPATTMRRLQCTHSMPTIWRCSRSRVRSRRRAANKAWILLEG